ncbi:MAG: sigma-54 dependent transcriptional regulator [Candidatus Omnitrophica bacterium]|nr:sigma-54 dependent transcriptional regulator [Candidatus Omnitrophota bacterium]
MNDNYEDLKVNEAQTPSFTDTASTGFPPHLQKGDNPENLSLKEKPFYGLLGVSSSMRMIYSLIERIASTSATVILRGESGTGKRMIAHAIHRADKNRCQKPFIEVPCGALPREIIESELFGHTKGAFTGAIAERKGRFELAHGGTILLDDIDAFSLEIQVKLLRVLQQREFEQVGGHKTIKVDTRVIVSTNQDLEKAVKEGKFREDLYYRLNVISIYVPPLRERKEDIVSLTEHLVNLFSKENHKKIHSLTNRVRYILANYEWPGNIRELENIIERAVILDTDNVIDIDDLPEVILSEQKTVSYDQKAQSNPQFSSLKDAMKEPEKIYILKVLKEVGWNKKKAAKKLGVNRTTLYNKLKRYSILSQVSKNG